MKRSRTRGGRGDGRSGRGRKKKVPHRHHASLPSLATPHVVLWGTSALGPSASVTREVRGAIAAGNPAPLHRNVAAGLAHCQGVFGQEQLKFSLSIRRAPGSEFAGSLGAAIATPPGHAAPLRCARRLRLGGHGCCESNVPRGHLAGGGRDRAVVPFVAGDVLIEGGAKRLHVLGRHHDPRVNARPPGAGQDSGEVEDELGRRMRYEGEV